MGAKQEEPMIAFHNLRYSITKNKKELPILDSVTGSMYRGEMTAVMGTSGAGKTTLLDILAGRRSLRNATLEGSLCLAGALPTDVVRKRYTGFCEQQDTLVAVLTVRETLECTAELKCAPSVTREQKVARVKEIIRELGLDGIADTVVGGATATTRSISGGQRKRVNIGNALITKPPILFLDEPTTGLDSATADDVLSVAAGLARDGKRAVIATLHSPSSRAFRLYVDKLLCLGTGGRVMWCAPTGTGGSGPLGRHLAECGFPYTEGDSLADLMMYTFGGGTEEDPMKRSIKFSEHWKESDVSRAEAERVEAAVEAAEKKHEDGEDASYLLNEAAQGSLAWDGGDARNDKVVATTMGHGVSTLLRYRSSRNFKDGEYIGARLGDKLLYGIILASLFWGEGSKQRNDSSVTNVCGLLWFIIILPGYGASAYIPQLVMEKPVILREVADGCYNPWTYLWYKIVEEFVCLLPFSLFFVGMLYLAVSLQGSFLVIWLVNYLCGCIGIAIAYWVAASSPNIEAANAILPTYVTINILVSLMSVFLSCSNHKCAVHELHHHLLGHSARLALVLVSFS